MVEIPWKYPKANDDIKNENENETNPHDIHSSSTEQSKSQSSTAPVTRRSMNTRSIPNTAAKQEEEKSRWLNSLTQQTLFSRNISFIFSAMLIENPKSWQSYSMAFIQFLLAQKQGYLFEHEITDETALRYHPFIRRPIAPHTIPKALESNGYQTKEYFKQDIYLMLYNTMKYNPRCHHVHRSAKHLFNITNPLFNLSPPEIQAQRTRKTNVSTSTNANDHLLVKRQQIK